MTLADHLVVASTAYCAHTCAEQKTVSRLLLGNGQRLALIASGEADLTTRKYESAMAWLSANWPADLAWPAGVPRPLPSGSVPEERPLDAPRSVPAERPLDAPRSVPEERPLVPPSPDTGPAACSDSSGLPAEARHGL